MKLFARLIRDQAGVTAIEYALIGSIMAVAIVVWATLMGQSLNSDFATISGYFTAG